MPYPDVKKPGRHKTSEMIGETPSVANIQTLLLSINIIKVTLEKRNAFSPVKTGAGCVVIST